MGTLSEIQHRILLYAREDEVVSPLPGLRMSCSHSAGLVTASIQEPCVAFVAQGAKRSEMGDLAFEFCAGQTLVVPGNLPIVGQVTKATVRTPYLAMAVSLKAAVIAELLATRNVTMPASNTGTLPRKANTELLDALNRLLALIDRHEDIGVLLPMLEREITWRLLRSEQGWLVSQIGQRNAQSSRVANVIQWMRERYAEPVGTEELAAMAGMSVSTFYRQFRAITASSPLQYQKQIRLQEARMLLLGGKADAITAAYAVGYQSQSQFSREYRRLFGLPPMQDVQRTRVLKETTSRLAIG